MRNIRVIKCHERYTQSMQSADNVTYADDLAVTTFRGFHEVAVVHTQRITSPEARSVLLDILEDLTNCLKKQQV